MEQDAIDKSLYGLPIEESPQVTRLQTCDSEEEKKFGTSFHIFQGPIHNELQ